MTSDEWDQHIAARKKARDDLAKKRRLMGRQKRLRTKLKNNLQRFRGNADLQLELRRVAALCIKLSVPLDPGLEREILKTVMES